MTLILVAVLLIIAVSFFLSFQSAGNSKNNVVLGVTLPQEAHSDPRVGEILVRYKRANLFLFAVALASGSLVMASRTVSVVILLLTLWIGLLLVGGNALVNRYSRKLMDLKVQENWYAGDSDVVQFWRGFVYNNPHDPRILVEKRFGYGQTFNIGNRKGKLLYFGTMIGVGVLMLGLISLFVALDTAQYALQITDDKVIIEAPLYGYTFLVEDIQSISLQNSLPRGRRTNGAETSSYALGNFQISGFGRSKLFAYKDNAPYIVIELPDLYVFFNAKTVGETRGYYEELMRLVP